MLKNKGILVVSVCDSWIMISLHIRAPETAAIKLKMQYAASKDSMKKTLTGKYFQFCQSLIHRFYGISSINQNAE